MLTKEDQERLELLQRRLKARAGRPGYAENEAALRKAIAELEAKKD